jgi:hypothetical protein
VFGEDVPGFTEVHFAGFLGGDPHGLPLIDLGLALAVVLGYLADLEGQFRLAPLTVLRSEALPDLHRVISRRSWPIIRSMPHRARQVRRDLPAVAGPFVRGTDGYPTATSRPAMLHRVDGRHRAYR